MKIKKIAVALGAAFSIMAFAANPANVSASERTKIVFWHEMTGPAQVELKRLVNEFNKHQDKYEVEAEFEGDYNEAVQKNFEHSRNGCFAGGFPGNGYFERTDVLQQAYDAGSKVH